MMNVGAATAQPTNVFANQTRFLLNKDGASTAFAQCTLDESVFCVL